MNPPASAPRGRRLSELLQALGHPCALASDPEITGVCADSRQVSPGDLFVAIRGFAQDGHRFISDAISRGAAAVVYEDAAFDPPPTEPVAAVRVANSRRAAAVAATEFFRHPSWDINLIGVTGTNGKTTTTLFLDSIFSAAGMTSGVIGTLGRRLDAVWRSADRTTPDAIELQELLADMRDSGVRYAAMEVSSHALGLDRVYGCRFAGTIFTNLTQDHLDYHSSLDEYLAAKLKLFTDFADAAAAGGRPMLAAVNMDDAAGRQVAELARCRVIPYGTNGGSQVRGCRARVTPAGASFELEIAGQIAPVQLQLTGHFNVHNALGAAACCHGLGFSLETIVAGLQALDAVPGRFERVSGDAPFSIIVDYAHTPDALHNVLSAGRALEPRRLLLIMGCGGDRDRGKRPKIGKIAGEEADVVIITSDNPRTEDPMDIIEDIRGGITGGEVIVEPDRHAAIFKGTAMCQPGDMLIIAGKGHETYQEFGNHRIDFDDRVVAREAIAARGL